MSGIYENNDALGMAELVKTKQVHPKELLEEAIHKIETLNPSLKRKAVMLNR